VAAGEPILLFLSRLHPKKGIVDRLLPAVAAMRTPCVLAIVGGEDGHAPGYEAEVRRTIEGLGLGSRVAMLGPVSGDERWAMFDGAAAFVLPSHAENFGIVVGEAMARGCPAVVTREVQSASLVERAGGGVVVCGEAAELSAALDRLLADEAERKAMGERGRAWANQHLQWSAVARQVSQMYDEVLKGAGSSPRRVCDRE
jgi:glycosyltransferase involved in cell wall biosynthesis